MILNRPSCPKHYLCSHLVWLIRAVRNEFCNSNNLKSYRQQIKELSLISVDHNTPTKAQYRSNVNIGVPKGTLQKSATQNFFTFLVNTQNADHLMSVVCCFISRQRLIISCICYPPTHSLSQGKKTYKVVLKVAKYF